MLPTLHRHTISAAVPTPHTLQVDDQLEGLAALDDEAEYQRFLAGLRGGDGASAAFSSFLDDEEDEGAQRVVCCFWVCMLLLLSAELWASLQSRDASAVCCAPHSVLLRSLTRMQTTAISIKSCVPCWAVCGQPLIAFFFLPPTVHKQLQMTAISTRSCVPCWVCPATSCWGSRAAKRRRAASASR